MQGNDWDFFHLRKPHYSCDELNQYLQLLPENVLRKTVVHQYEGNIIQNKNVYGYHIPYHSLETLGKQIKNIVSISCHQFEEILALKNKQIKVNHMLLSPVFKSISKQNYFPHYTLDEYKLFLSENEFPFRVIALGGITKNRQNEVIKLGFDGFAVLGDFWKNYSIR